MNACSQYHIGHVKCILTLAQVLDLSVMPDAQPSLAKAIHAMPNEKH